MSIANIERIKEQHPCFSNEAHFKYGRVHLPVALKCNIQCGYCLRSINSFEYRPGVTERILSPSEAMEILREALRQDYPLTVAGVAGPGEPLDNQETFEVFEMVQKEFPNLIKCVATNGLALSEKAGLLRKLGINTVTVTANAIDPEIGEKIYGYLNIKGKRYTGREAAGILINRQQEGVKKAASLGMLVKVNTVFIPGVNGGRLVEIARRYAELGASIMNIMPLIPIGKFKGMTPPGNEEIFYEQAACGEYIDQFTRCRQCRADACGIPGIERKRRNNNVHT
jgi:nitrogen fixation protein NifB